MQAQASSPPTILHIGTSPGGDRSGQYRSNVAHRHQRTVNLPTNGATIYVQLWTSSPADHSSPTTTLTPRPISAAAITSPSPGSTLTRRINDFYMECRLRRRHRILFTRWQHPRWLRSGQYRSVPAHRHQRYRESAHERSHDLRAALDTVQRRIVPLEQLYLHRGSIAGRLQVCDWVAVVVQPLARDERDEAARAPFFGFNCLAPHGGPSLRGLSWSNTEQGIYG